MADRVSWVAGAPPDPAVFEADVRIRYKGSAVPAVVDARPRRDDTVIVEFRAPERAVAPGQSVVFYGGDEVLGGGRIRESLR